MMRTIDFKIDENNGVVYLEYTPYIMENEILAKLGLFYKNNELVKCNNVDQLPTEIKKERPTYLDDFSIIIKRTFYFKQKDIASFNSDEETLFFKFMKIIKTSHYKFFLIRKRLLDIDQDVLFVSKKSEDNFSFKREFFCTGYQKRTSVLKKASNLISGKFIVILSDNLSNEFQGKQGTISFADYKELLDTFPTTRVLEHYGDKIIADNLTNFMLKKNYSELFIKSKNMVMEKHKENLIKIGNNSLNYNIATNLDKSFKILKKEIETESSIQDESYWQKIILNILPVIYPQYIGFIREFVIPENISKENKTTKRRIDHALIDVNGNVDLLEVKCPFPKNHLIMKSKYRDNYIAARELEGGIFQLEKYIYYIDHLGLKEGNKISEKIKSKIRNKENYKISQNFHLKFSNPKGILLIGHCKFTELERIDFDIIRKQYNNIMDIITYDDLLDRLERLLAFYKS